MEIKTDIVIVGAALNGLAAALALGGAHAVRPLDLVIVDKADPRLFAMPSFLSETNDEAFVVRFLNDFQIFKTIANCSLSSNQQLF